VPFSIAGQTTSITLTTARCSRRWTTAPGNDANDGLTPGTPKASIGAMLAAYQLAGVVRVDAGAYALRPTSLSPATTPA